MLRMGTRNFSNDDIITDMISEIKIEKSLMNSRASESFTVKYLEETRPEPIKEDEDISCIDPRLLQVPTSESENPNHSMAYSIKEPETSTDVANVDNRGFGVYDLRAAAYNADPDSAISFRDIFKKRSSSGNTESIPEVPEEEYEEEVSQVLEYDDSSNGDLTSPLDSDYIPLSTYNTPAKLDAIRESDEESEPMFLDSAISLNKNTGKGHTPLISFSSVNLLKSGKKNQGDEDEDEVEDEDTKEDFQREHLEKEEGYEDTEIGQSRPPMINVLEDSIFEEDDADADDGVSFNSQDGDSLSKFQSNVDPEPTSNHYLEVPQPVESPRPFSAIGVVQKTHEAESANAFNSTRAWKFSSRPTAISMDDKGSIEKLGQLSKLSYQEQTSAHTRDFVRSAKSPSNNSSYPPSLISKEKRSMASTPRLMLSTNKDTLEVISMIESDQSSPIASDAGYKLPNMQHNNVHVNRDGNFRPLSPREDNVVSKELNFPNVCLSSNTREDDAAKSSTKTLEEDIEVADDNYDFLNLKSSFAFRSGITTAISNDDRLTDQSNLNPKIPREISALLFDETDHCDHLNKASGKSAIYLGPSPTDLLETDHDKRFTDITTTEKIFENIQDKDDWIKSLDSAFEIDDNLSNELERMVNNISSIESSSSSDPQQNSAVNPGSSSHPKTVMQTLAQYNKKYGFKFTKSAVDKHGEKQQNPPASAKSATSNGGIGEGECGTGTGMLYRISSKINTLSRPSSGYKANGKNTVNNELDNKVAKAGNLDSGDLSNNGVSAPGTVTARLYEDIGIHTQSKESPLSERHFIEVIKTPSTTDKNSVMSPTKLKNEEAETETNKTDDNYWKTSNRFMDRKKPIGRSKTIRKIFTAMSKGSGGLKDGTEQDISVAMNSQDEQETSSKVSWGNALFRGKSIHGKRMVSQSLSLTSGASLDGYAGDYASNHEFKPPEESQVLSTETTDARKIIQMSNTTDASQSDFVDISNGVPISRDSSLSTDTSGTMVSSIRDELRTNKTVEDYTPTPIPGDHKSLTALYRRKNLRFGSLKRNKSLSNVDSIRNQTITFSNNRSGHGISKETENENADYKENNSGLERTRSNLNGSTSRLGGMFFTNRKSFSQRYQGTDDYTVDGSSLGQLNGVEESYDDENYNNIGRRKTLLKRFRSVYRK